MGKRSTKFYRKNESEVMKRLGFKPTKNSGAGWIEKEDGQNEAYICQLKSTDKQSISIKQNDLHTLENNASISHKTPVFVFQFLNLDEVWIAIKEDEFKEFMEFKQQEEKEEQFSFSDENNIDKEGKGEYNINVPQKNVSKSYVARRDYHKKLEQEKEQIEKELKERRKGSWKRNSNKRE